jgi:hypothetical protein
MRAFAVLVATSVCGMWQGVASAANPLTCAQAYEKAQEEKTAGQLNAAIGHLKSCIDSSCAQFIREDCRRWMDQTESALPSVVFSARQDGKDLTNVEILCDGNLLTGTLDGKALPIDPGLHQFTFNVPGLAPVARQLLVREGEHNRIIDVELSRPHRSGESMSPSTSVKTALPPPRTGTNALAYGLAGVGTLGVAGFTMFAILGNNRQGELERSCAPNCQSSQVDSVRTKYMIADTCLGVGLVSLGLATYLFMTNHGEGAPEHQQTTSISFIPQSTGAGGVLQLSGSY